MNMNSGTNADSTDHFDEIVSRMAEEKEAGRSHEEEIASAIDFLAMGS